MTDSTSREKYILMLPRWYPNIRDEADGNFIEKHIKCISAGIRVRILFVMGLEGKYLSRIKGRGDDAACIHYFPNTGGIAGKLINPLRYLFHQFRLYRKLEKIHGRPLLCHVHVMSRTSILANYLRLRHGIPFIVSEHWAGYYPEAKAMTMFKKWSYKILFRNADAVTAVSESLLEAIKPFASLSARHEVIPNIVDQSFFAPLSPYNHRSYFVHVSNLKAVKQTAEIIAMLGELSAEGNDIRLLVIGDGPERKRLEELARNTKSIRDNIEFRGQLEAGLLAGIVANSAAILSFSRFETQSIVLLEAIALGIPVVAPETGGIPEHCRGRGILFPVNSKPAFREALLRIAGGRFAMDRDEGRKYAMQHFSDAVVRQKFLNLYDKVSNH